MVSHNEGHSVRATILSPERKTNLNFTNTFLEDAVPQKRNGETASPSSEDVCGLGDQNAEPSRSKKIQESVPHDIFQIGFIFPSPQISGDVSLTEGEKEEGFHWPLDDWAKAIGEI